MDQPIRTRGAQPGNTNALKHGFYARHLPASFAEELDGYQFNGLREEQQVLRYLLTRVLVRAEQATTLEQNMRLLRITSLAIATLARVARIEKDAGLYKSPRQQQADEENRREIQAILDRYSAAVSGLTGSATTGSSAAATASTTAVIDDQVNALPASELPVTTSPEPHPGPILNPQSSFLDLDMDSDDDLESFMRAAGYAVNEEPAPPPSDAPFPETPPLGAQPSDAMPPAASSTGAPDLSAAPAPESICSDSFFPAPGPQPKSGPPQPLPRFQFFESRSKRDRF